MDKDRIFRLRAKRSEAQRIVGVFESEECQYVLQQAEQQILNDFKNCENPEAVVQLKHELNALKRVIGRFHAIKGDRDKANHDLKQVEG